jgi:alkylation response protein AidB-like acyl-CoA dehydrogenase
MDIRLSEEQLEMARQARRFLEKECPLSLVRDLTNTEVGISPELWGKIAEMGWLGMILPESCEGLGLPLMDLVVVLEEMGRAVLPGPFYSTAILAAGILMEAGIEARMAQYLPPIAKGRLRGTLALQEPDGGADPGYIRMTARPQGKGYLLNGTKLLVPDAHTANFLILAARTEGDNDTHHGITLFLVEPGNSGITISLLPTLDATRKFCAVEFTNVRVEREAILGSLNQGFGPLERVLAKAQVGLAADSVGCAQRAMEMAVEYAKVRIQFDQPIGGFQAVKHACARMYEAVESARSLLYWAAWAQDSGSPREAAISASAAKAYCTEAARNVTASALQVLGGTGFSWEHDLHLFLKRAKANETVLGDPIYHREKIARLMEPPDSLSA